MGDWAYRRDMAACTASACHLWDAGEGDCTHNVNTKSNKKLLTDILAELKGMHSTEKDILSTEKDILSTEKDVLKYVKHIH